MLPTDIVMGEPDNRRRKEKVFVLLLPLVFAILEGLSLSIFALVLDVLALAAAIGELTSHTRRARTAQWCALQTASRDVPAHCVTSAEVAARQTDQNNLGQVSPILSARCTMGPVKDAAENVTKPTVSSTNNTATTTTDAADSDGTGDRNNNQQQHK